MIYDLNTTQLDKINGGYDVCIAGGGVAGITRAIKLAEQGRRILLLEAGGWEYTEDSQKVYQGENVGRSYYELDEVRLRFLGGTSNHWEGKCRPLDALDFEARSYIPDSGWPFDKSELDPYLEGACEIFEIPTDFHDEPLDGSEKMFDAIKFQWSPPVRFGEKYGDALKASHNIDLFLNANLVDMRLDDNARHVDSVLCANYVEPTKHFTFSSKIYVMALGAIENPRMLLNFRHQMPGGIGNKHDLVGRYFMEHFAALGGYYVTDEDVWPFGQEEIFFAASPKLTNQRGIAHARLQVGPLFVPGESIYDQVKHRVVCSEDIVRDFIRNFKEVWCPVSVYIGGYLHIVSEQIPNRDSRVTLSDQMDHFGLNRTKLDWRITEQDRRTLKQIVAAFGAYMVDRNFGNVKLVDWMLDDKMPVPSVGQDEWHGAGYHHMGTTRMANTPSKGVVDKNCRVFGTDNLFIAGSSVFPTSGHANPTFTIVQLTLRLSEHLDSILNKPRV